jgi:hypothetical protein
MKMIKSYQMIRNFQGAENGESWKQYPFQYMARGDRGKVKDQVLMIHGKSVDQDRFVKELEARCDQFMPYVSNPEAFPDEIKKLMQAVADVRGWKLEVDHDEPIKFTKPEPGLIY